MFRRSLLFAPVLVSMAFAAAVPNRAPLQPNAFDPLPLGSIEPQGWLRQQLQLQADGLTGHLGEFWKDVDSNSGWLGGSGESWERGPYYLDGLLPLAYELGNQPLIAKAKQWVDWTLDHQRSDGQIGPAKNDDWWPRMVMLKVLTQYAEVTGDRRVEPVMSKYFRYELANLPGRPLRDWGKYRWHDNVYTVLWLYNRTGEKSLLDLARLLQQQGYDWQGEFTHFPYTDKTSRSVLRDRPNRQPSDHAMQTHGVNNAMALKASPLSYLLSGNPIDRSALTRQMAILDRYHGLPNGMFSGDEHLAGPDPSQGIELCAVVEAMFSLEEAFAILGDTTWADRLEKITFNALPGTLSNDMWSHQYDQQPNQISCTRAHRQWSTNNDDSNTFGLQPNFGCCTANLHQGWPKFTEALWMATRDGGFIAAAYAPNRLKSGPVTIDETTDYPFRPSVVFTVHVSRPVAFPIVLRIPAWAKSGKVSVNGKAEPLKADSQSLQRIARKWKNGDRIELAFDTPPRVTHSFNDSVVFERGPLVFALPLDAQWKEVKHNGEKSSDWQLTSQADWNYAVALSDECPARVQTAQEGSVPFDVQDPRVTLRVFGRRLGDWGESQNSAGPLPKSPVQSTAKLQELTLVPYGSAKLRITAFPYTREAHSCQTLQSSNR